MDLLFEIDRKSYTDDDMKTAIKRVTCQGWSVYKASRMYKIPYSTLKSRLRNFKLTESNSVKVGRPFNLSIEQELAIVAYIKEIQETGLKLTPSDIRRYAYKISREKYRNRFNDSKKIAGWDWWLSFKKRHNVCTTLNFYTPVSKVDKSEAFFHFYRAFVNKFALTDKPHLIWSFITTHFSYITESTLTKKVETVNVLLSMNAAGQKGPCAIVSKSPIANDGESATFDDSFITVSDNGSISQNVFYDYLTWFIKKGPKDRPIVILLNSKNEFMSSRSRIYAKLNGITFLPFPFEGTYVLESLQSFFVTNMVQFWRKSIGNFVKKIRNKPVLDDFFHLFSPVYLEGTSEEIIVDGFSKTGIWPINPNIVKSSKSKKEHSEEDSEEDYASDIPTDILNQMYENTDENIINDLELSLKNIEDDDEVLIVLVG